MCAGRGVFCCVSSRCIEAVMYVGYLFSFLDVYFERVQIKTRPQGVSARLISIARRTETGEVSSIKGGLFLVLYVCVSVECIV